MESGLDMGNWKRLREKGQLKVGVLEMEGVEVPYGSDERKRSKVKDGLSAPTDLVVPSGRAIHTDSITP